MLYKLLSMSTYCICAVRKKADTCTKYKGMINFLQLCIALSGIYLFFTLVKQAADMKSRHIFTYMLYREL